MITPLRGVCSAIVILLLPLIVAAQPSYEDPFDGPSLSSGWQPRDNYALKYPQDVENHATFGMTGTQLSISFASGADHNQWEVQHAQVTGPFLGSGTYEIKMDSTFTGAQQFGLVFQGADHRTFLMFMLMSYINDEVKAYVERFSYANDWVNKTTFQGGRIGRSIPAAGPYYVRVTVDDHAQPEQRTWRFQWSENGLTWTDLVEGGLEGIEPHQNMGAIQSVGVFAGNGSIDPPVLDGFDARFDYFRYYSPGTLPLAAPSNLVTRSGDDRVDLWWDAVAGADQYVIYGASVPGGPYTQLGTSTVPSFSHLGATNDIHHYYVVKAYKAGIEGQPSPEVEAVPHAAGALATLPIDGLAVLLSASELAYTHDSGEAVTVWATALGGTAAAFGTGGNSPTFVSSGVNGQPAVRFDGVSDYMTLSGTFHDFTQGASVYVVAKPATVTSGLKYLLLGNGPSWDGIGFGSDIPASGLIYFTYNQSGGVDWFTTNTGVVAGESSLVSVVQDAGAGGSSSYAEIAKNGVPLHGAIVNVPSVASRTLNYIGKSYWGDAPFHGDIAEIIVYNRKLNAAEQAAVRSYVAVKYGLPIDGNPGTPQAIPAPASLTAVAGDNSVALTWTPVTAATGYRVYRTGPSQPATQITSVATANYIDTTVANGFTYSYTVTAFDAYTESSHSSSAMVIPTAPAALPASVPADGLVLALDAATALQDFGDNEAVTVWRDGSSSHHHATTAGPRPIVVSNALNGKPVVRFDGIDDYMTLASGFDNFSAGSVLYIVVRPSSPLKSSKLLVLGNGKDVDNIGFHAWSSGGLLYFVGSSGHMTWFETGPALVAGEASLLSVIQQGVVGGFSYAEVAKNGTPLSGQTLLGPRQVERSQNYIGYSHWGEGTFQGDIAEVLLYNRALTSAEQTAVRQYFAGKYGITVQ